VAEVIWRRATSLSLVSVVYNGPACPPLKIARSVSDQDSHIIINVFVQRRKVRQCAAEKRGESPGEEECL